MSGIETKRPTSSARDWRVRLKLISDTMREMSRQSDPQELVHTYAANVRDSAERPDDRAQPARASLPEFRITRDTEWKEPINPWTGAPPLTGAARWAARRADLRPGACIIQNLEVPANDPAASYLAGQRLTHGCAAV